MIRLRTLGAIELRGSNGEELHAVIAQPRRIALLAFLAIAKPRGQHRRDALIAMFWPERDEDSARNALSQAVHFLRRQLGSDALVGRNANELGLAPGSLWCDAVAFEETVGAGSQAQALELYQGDLLDGFHITEAPQFEEWLDTERAHLRERYVRTMEELAEGREAAGDFGGAVALWRRIAARDSLSSRVALRLMRALASAGDPAAAVQHARVHEALLLEEVGVGPDPSITALVQQLRAIRAAGRPAPAIPAGDQLSPAAGSIAGDEVVAEGLPGEGAEGPRAPALPERPWRHRRLLVRRAFPVLAGVVALVVFRQTTRDSESFVHQLYLRGQQAEASRSLIGLQTARAAYESAIERDSSYALGYAGLAGVHGYLADYNYAPALPALDTARQMALKALALDSTLSDVRIARAVTLGDAREFDAAEREFRRAIEIDPRNARAHYWYSILLVALGRGEDAMAEVRIALDLESIPPRGLHAMQRYATWLITGQRQPLDVPISQRQDVLKLEPSEPWARSMQAVDLAKEGDCDGARTEIAQAEQLAPDNLRMLASVGAVHWSCGDSARARDVLGVMKRHPDARNHGYRMAMVHALMNEPDSAFAWLGQQRWTMAQLSGLSADERLDALRSDDRYDALLKRLGIRR